MACSTPDALSLFALIALITLSTSGQSPNGLRNIYRQTGFFKGSQSEMVFLTSYIKEIGLAPKLFTIKHILI